MTKWKAFAEWIFYGLIGYIAFNVSTNMEKFQSNMQELNRQFSVMMAEKSYDRKSIDDHEVRLRVLEQTK